MSEPPWPWMGLPTYRGRGFYIGMIVAPVTCPLQQPCWDDGQCSQLNCHRGNMKTEVTYWCLRTRLCSRPAQIFFGKLGQTPRPTFGQIVAGHQFSATSDIIWPRLRSSEGTQVRLILTTLRPLGASEAWSNDVRGGWKLVSSHNLAKRRPWSLSKFSKKKFGLAYCAAWIISPSLGEGDNFKREGIQQTVCNGFGKWPSVKWKSSGRWSPFR